MSRRTNPSASLEMASRHRFRHLSDPAALKRNRLVSHLLPPRTNATTSAVDVSCEKGRRSLFDLAERCRNEELEAGAAQSDRRYQVFLRAVLSDEPWHAVAKDLGLSRRQFTRDKTSFSISVAQRLNTAASAFYAHAFSITTSDADAALVAAQVFAACGDVEKALKMLRDVANSSPSIDCRLEAICAEARLMLERSYLPRSSALVSQARQILQTSRDGDGLCSLIAFARLDTMRPEILSRTSSAEDALRLLGRALNATPSAVARGWRDSRGDALRALRVQMEICFLTGSVELAKAASQEAEREMDANKEIPLLLKADVLSDRAVVLGASAKTTSDAQALLLEARNTATRAGLRSRALAATIILLNQRNRRAPFERINECITAAEQLGDDVLFVRACLAGSEQQLLHEPSRGA
jgi:tetratricopeptide (TPR) repeat protein